MYSHRYFFAAREKCISKEGRGGGRNAQYIPLVEKKTLLSFLKFVISNNFIHYVNVAIKLSLDVSHYYFSLCKVKYNLDVKEFCTSSVFISFSLYSLPTDRNISIHKGNKKISYFLHDTF